MTITLETEDGSTSPIPASEFNARMDQAVDRIRDDYEQLSFEVGSRGKDRPDFASVKIAGDLPVSHDLRRRRELVVRVVADGEVIAEAAGVVTGIAFKDKTDKYGTTTERVHTVTLQ